MHKSLTTQVDWLEFTVKGLTADQVITNLLGLDTGEFYDLERGRFGYNSQLKWERGNVFLMTNRDMVHGRLVARTDDVMGIHVLITGTGCSAYAIIRPIHVLLSAVIGICGDGQYKFTRIDLAVDDKANNLLSFDRIYRHATDGDYTSRWGQWIETISRKSSDNGHLGRTMYFGSQKSDIFCRIYDKALEQRIKHPDLADTLPKAWTRLEIVYKQERATLLAQHMLTSTDVGVVIQETMNHYIRFLKRSNDSNKARWDSAPWWLIFIEEAGKLQLTMPKQDRTIDDMKAWVEDQIAPTLAAISAAYEGDLEWLYKMLGAGKGRLKRKHLDAIAAFVSNGAYPS